MSASADRVHSSREEINIHRIYYKCLTIDMINRIYIFIYSEVAGRNTGIRACHFNLLLHKVEIHKWRICVHLLIWVFCFVLFYVWFSNFKVAQSMRFKHKAAQSCKIKHKVARSFLGAVFWALFQKPILAISNIKLHKVDVFPIVVLFRVH